MKIATTLLMCVLAASLASCGGAINVPNGGVSCGTNGECPTGQVCVSPPGDDKCYDVGNVPDQCQSGAAKCDPHASCDWNGTTLAVSCTCDSGFNDTSTGKPGTMCTDIDECAQTPSVCGTDPNIVCTNTPGSYTCQCGTGYTLDTSTNMCVDINECVVTPNICGPGTCTNTVGAYDCACNNGYEFNNTTCVNINECTEGVGGVATNPACGMNTNCTDKDPTSGSNYSCACKSGYQGSDPTGAGCTDIDECSPDPTVACPVANTTCNNTPGSFNCTCDTGFTGDPSSLCSPSYIAMGHNLDTTCAVRSDGTLWCWGGGGGALGIICTCTDPIGSCTGCNAFPQPITQILPGTTFSDVAMSEEHGCAVTTTGQLMCWGQNGSGQLGNTAGSTVYTPTAVDASNTWTKVSVGSGGTTCGLKNKGTGDDLECLGANYSGQLGTGVSDNTAHNTPAAIKIGGVAVQDFTSVSVGQATVCAIRSDTSLWCWGSNGNGQMATGTTDGTIYAPTQIMTSAGGTGFTAVSVGANNTFAIQSNVLYAWGTNGTYGTLGTGDTNSYYTPTALTGSWSSVAADDFNLLSCGVQTDGSGWCWGQNVQGSIDATNAPSYPTPTRIAGSWSKVLVGDFFSTWFGNFLSLSGCGIRPDTTIACWGSTAIGQADGIDHSVALSPVQTNNSSWFSISLGQLTQVSCGIQIGGTLWCWGRDTNNNGLFGAGQAASGAPVMTLADTPSQIGTDSDWTEVSVGDDHVCGVKNGGELWCWGSDSSGQLGDGGTTQQYAPEMISTGWSSVFAVGSSTCGTKMSDTNLYCWGNNGSYQLGTGNNTNLLVPTAVNSFGITAVSGNNQNLSGVTSWGSYSTGYDYYGECNQGSGVTTGTQCRTTWGSTAGTPYKVFAINYSDMGCGIDQSSPSNLYCAGSNYGAGLVNENAGYTNFTDLTSSYSAFCTIASGMPYCFGYNYGGLGYGWNFGNGALPDNGFHASPVPVNTSVTGWTKIAGGYDHTCGLVGSKLYCWGEDDTGELGDGKAWSATPIPSPIP
jgi:alpha-tubulin suppressor-like RCC1 family protein